MTVSVLLIMEEAPSKKYVAICRRILVCLWESVTRMREYRRKA